MITNFLEMDLYTNPEATFLQFTSIQKTKLKYYERKNLQEKILSTNWNTIISEKTGKNILHHLFCDYKRHWKLIEMINNKYPALLQKTDKAGFKPVEICLSVFKNPSILTLHKWVKQSGKINSKVLALAYTHNFKNEVIDYLNYSLDKQEDEIIENLKGKYKIELEQTLLLKKKIEIKSIHKKLL